MRLRFWETKSEPETARPLALAHIATRLFNTPLMIEPGKLAVIEQVLGPRFGLVVPPSGVDAAAYVTDPQRRKPYQVTTEGTAIINVFGSLVQRAGGAEADSGLTSYQQLSREFDQALEDADVKKILLLVDSPGGEAAGVWDLVDQIAAGVKKKPVMALADGMAASAAYAIASAATEIYATQGSNVGSIGVIASHLDQSEYDKAMGLKVTHIFAGAHKADFSPHAPLTEGATSEIVKLVDDAYQLFVSKVAAARDLSEEAVRATEARLFTTAEAQSLKLIDGVRTLEQLLAGDAQQLEEVPMPGTLTLAQLQADYPALLQQHVDTQLKATVEKATDDERARIKEICDLASVQFPPVLQDALFAAPVDAGTAAKALLTAKDQVRTTFAAAFLSDAGKPVDARPAPTDERSADEHAVAAGRFVQVMRDARQPKQLVRPN